MGDGPGTDAGQEVLLALFLEEPVPVGAALLLRVRIRYR